MFRAIPLLFLPLLLAAGCGLAGGHRTGPAGNYLRPGPLGPDNGGVYVPASRLPARAIPALPPAFSPTQGRAPLPGGTLPGIAEVRALVLPISLGERIPALAEGTLASGYFGADAAVPGTLRDALRRESDGAFRLSSEVLPVLVNPAPVFRRRAPTPVEVRRLAEEALGSWAAATDLSRFDNDGADGIPGSPDDDGSIDLFFLVVETEFPFQPFTLPVASEIRAPGRSRVGTGPIHVIPAAGGVLPDPRVPLDQVLASLGLGPSERFFPAGYPRTLSTLARARLGWLPARAAGEGGEYRIESGRALLVPLSDLSPGAGFWLVERSGERIYTSRIALRPDGHYQVTDSAHWTRGSEQPLPLSFQLGMRGPVARVSWSEDRPAPAVTLGTSDPARPGAPLDAVGGARPATPPGGYRWVRLGNDSVRVAIAGEPLALP